MPPTSCGNSLTKEGNSPHKNPFLWCNASLINLCARHLNGLVAFGSSWGVVFHGLSSANGMILCLMINNGPLRKHVKSFGTPCKIMVGLSGNGPSQTWRRPQTWPTKMLLTNSIQPGGSKVLLWPKIILWSRERLAPRMHIIFWFPLDLRQSSRGGCILDTREPRVEFDFSHKERALITCTHKKFIHYMLQSMEGRHFDWARTHRFEEQSVT